MILQIPSEILSRINAHGEAAYPEEGAGLLLGKTEENVKRVSDILPLVNSREDAARRNRYLLTAQDYMAAEDEADRLGLDVLGIFHSHPDHPNRPSEFDLQWAMPWFSYLITSVYCGAAAGSRSWELAADRSHFLPEEIDVVFEEILVSK
jgi:proteasome lid subunit RPN8/RPN11